MIHYNAHIVDYYEWLYEWIYTDSHCRDFEDAQVKDKMLVQREKWLRRLLY
jgi:hypothetical protein